MNHYSNINTDKRQNRYNNGRQQYRPVRNQIPKEHQSKTNELKNQLSKQGQNLDLYNCYTALKDQNYDLERALSYILSKEFKPWTRIQDEHQASKHMGSKTLNFGEEQPVKVQKKQPRKDKKQEKKQEEAKIEIQEEKPVEEKECEIIIEEQPQQQEQPVVIEEQKVEEEKPIEEQQPEQQQQQQVEEQIQEQVQEQIQEQQQPVEEQQVVVEVPIQQQPVIEVQKEEPQQEEQISQEQILNSVFPSVPNCPSFSQFINQYQQLYKVYLDQCRQMTQQQ